MSNYYLQKRTFQNASGAFQLNRPDKWINAAWQNKQQRGAIGQLKVN